MWSLFRAGYLPVIDSSELRIVARESICQRASRAYSEAARDTARAALRRVTVIQVGDRYVVIDPYSPQMAGEWALELVVDRQWHVIVRMGM
jgi:hypothetical protein